MISAPSSVMPIMASQVFPLAFFFDCEHLLQPSDLSLGFHAVFFKGGFQLSVLSPLRHLRQRGQYFLFREVNVLKRVVEQIIKSFWWLSHADLLWMRRALHPA